MMKQITIITQWKIKSLVYEGGEIEECNYLIWIEKMLMVVMRDKI